MRFSFFLLTVLLISCSTKRPQPVCEPAERNPALASIDSMGIGLQWPDELEITGFAGPGIIPSPACLSVAPSGEVFVGVDMMGSLGKRPGRGRIIKMVDCDNDGIIDRYTEYAKVDNPRGIIAMGDKVYVLHTAFTDTLATGMDLVVFEDKDNDGVADAPPQPLIQHISSYRFLQSRGTDHATNGIRMGIDGWIYIAVGDFGFHDAIDRDETKLTMLGGGIVRVRPDGRGMEVFSHGLRNIYDIAIDPYLNFFTLDNTNDGGGWNTRFSHQLQNGEYGYPVLFKHFTEEIIPALVDLGGGSGTGSLFMDDPNWPEKYNRIPMMADWGRSHLYINRVTPADGSFTQQQEEFIRLPQITDLDVDASGRLYMTAWDGAGYTGDSTKGFMVRAVPKNWQHKPFPELADVSYSDLKNFLKSESGAARLHAQQELLRRSPKKAADAGWDLASDKSLPLHLRVTGIFTYAQGAGKDGIKKLLQLVEDEQVREYALKALTDRKDHIKEVPSEPFIAGLKDPSKRVRIAAIIGLERLGRPETATALLEVPVSASFVAPPAGEEGPHATPNPDIIPGHLAASALASMNAVDACVSAIGGEHNKLALWALRYTHDEKAVKGLIEAYDKTDDAALKNDIIVTLARLYTKEADYDGSWWWSTRPDTHGPYYKPVTWEASETIQSFLQKEWEQSDEVARKVFTSLNEKFRMGINRFGGSDLAEAKQETKIDLEKIRNTKGQIGKTSIEDVMLAIEKIKGDTELGKKLYVQQGCIACHSIAKGEPLKGPFMGQIGAIMSRQQIAESILKPNASISQGFATVLITTKDGKSIMGFVTGESGDKLTLRDITGTSYSVKIKDIQSRKEMETSMMPPGLADALSFEEFASLITYLFQQKG
ncbi:MAG: c-type cytochrome [Chitinophagaceae bacterium]|nr:c-type cytochrome [Chitinophagaceae bacterium]MCW5928857.1 c-type cytochrome [Chitinophagaceae bacterium]